MEKLTGAGRVPGPGNGPGYFGPRSPQTRPRPLGDDCTQNLDPNPLLGALVHPTLKTRFGNWPAAIVFWVIQMPLTPVQRSLAPLVNKTYG